MFTLGSNKSPNNGARWGHFLFWVLWLLMECFLCRMSLLMKQLMCTQGKWGIDLMEQITTGCPPLTLSLGRLIWASLCDSYSQALSIAMRLCSWWFSSGRFICKDRLPVPLNVAALKPLGWPEAHWLHLIKLPVRKATASCLLQHCSKPLIGRKNCFSDKLQEASTEVFM